MTITNEQVRQAVTESQNVAHRVWVNRTTDGNGIEFLYTSRWGNQKSLGYAKAGEWFAASVQGFSLAVALTQPKP